MTKLHTVTTALTPVAPFDFGKTLDFLDSFAPAMGGHQHDSRSLTKALAIDGQTVGFRVTNEGSVEQPQLSCTLYAEAPIRAALKAEALDQIAYFLSLNDDLCPFYDLAQTDEAFAPVVEALYGYHQVKFASPFENAVWALISQRNLMSVAGKMKAALAERFGGTLTLGGETYRAFPDPARLAQATSYELAEAIGHGAKAVLIQGAAKAFSRMDDHWLRDAPYAEVEAWLKSIKGIGDWSATFILLRALGRSERLPVKERRTLDAAAKAYGLFSINDAELYRIGARYGKYIGLWAHYLRAAV